MADKYDGSIIINTKLDNSGFGKGSAEMKSAISSLQHQVDALGKRMDSTFASMQRAMSNSARSAQQYSKSVNSASKKSGKNRQAESVEERFDRIRKSLAEINEAAAKVKAGDPKALEEYNAKVRQTREDIEALTNDIAQAANTPVKTQAFKDLEEMITKADNKLQAMYNRREKMELHGQKNSKAYNNLSKDIEQAQLELEGLRTERQEMLDDGTNDPDMSAYITPGQTEQFLQYEEALAGFHNALSDMREELAETFGKTYKFEVETQQAETQGPQVADPESVASTEVETQISQLQTALEQINSTGDQVVSAAAQAATMTGAEYMSALDGVADSLSQFDEQSDTVQEQIAQCRAALEEFGNTTFTNQSFVDLQTEAEQVGARLEELAAQEHQMDDAGLGGTEAYSALEDQIAQCTARLLELGNQMSVMRAEGTDIFTGSETDAFQGYTQDLDNFEARLQGMRGEVDAAVSPSGMAEARWSQMSTLSGILENALFSAANAATRFAANAGMAFQHPVQAINRLGVAALETAQRLGMMAGHAVVNGLKQIANAAGEAAKKFLGFGRSVKSSNGALQGGLWNIIKYGLGVRSVFALVNRLRSAIKEGFSNLAQVSSPVNTAINNVMGSLNMLKNSLASAFAPIFTAVAPAIVYLCNLLATAMSYIAQFMSAITGGRTYMKATKGAENFAAGVGKAGDAAASAAKEASKQLASFDKLDILTDDSKNNGGSGGGGGAGGAGTAAADLFETVPIESAIADFIQRIKDAFAAGEYEEVGRIIAEGINGAVRKIRDFIKWENVHEFWEHWVDVFCRIANSLVKNIDWYLIGETIAEGFNTLLHILELFLTGMDWGALGRALGTGLNGIVDYLDWGLLGRVIGERFQAALDFLYNAVKTFRWNNLGRGIAESVNSLVKTINWQEIGQTFSGGVRGLLQAATTAIKEIDWSEVGKSFAEMLAGVDWSGIIHDVFEGIGAVSGALASLIGGFLSDAVEGAKEYFAEKIEECGGDVVLGIFSGILDAVKGVGKWIVENIFSPFTEGFKDAFGINSPAKKMEPYGAYIFAGVLKGILRGVRGIGKWVKKHILEPIQKALEGSNNSLELTAEVEFVKKTGQTLEKLIGAAMTATVSFIKKSGQTLEKLIGTASNAVVTFAKKSGQTLEKLIGTASNAVVTFAKKSGQTLGKLIGTASNAVVTFAKKSGQTLEKLIGTASSAVVTFAKKSGQTLEKLIGTASKATVTFLKKSGQTLAGLIGTWLTATVNFIKKSGQSLEKLIGTWLTATVSFIKRSGQTLEKLIGTWSTATVNFIKRSGQTLGGLIGTWLDVTVNFISRAGQSLRSLLGLSGGGAIVGNAVRLFASGGVIRGSHMSWWDSVQKYGSGTHSAHGTAFIAGEAGPEIVGHVNGRTEVLNKSQLADAIYSAVLAAAAEAVKVITGYIGGRLVACANGIISALYQVTDFAEAIPVTVVRFPDLRSPDAGVLRILDTLGELGAAFYAPVMSTGTVMPYSVQAGSSSGQRKSGIDETDLDELGQVVVSAISSAAMALVTAIQQSGAKDEPIDLSSITQRTIDDINRRTRMYSESPII